MKQDGIQRALWLRHFGLQFVFRMPPISRRHRSGAERSWRGRAGSRQDCAYFLIILDLSKQPKSACATRCAQLPADAQQNVQIVYVAHSIPLSMANTSDYVRSWRK